MDSLTDIKFWENYWSSKNIEKINNLFPEELINKIPSNSKLIEIGGFPGHIVAYFKKKLNCDVTILDFYIDERIIKTVEKINEIEESSIKSIRADFLTVVLKEKYDVVCSFGFIEHFHDTKEIIEKHLKCLKKGGALFITIPNFRGVNGLVQFLFHSENYQKHNINCMKITFLIRLMQELHLKNIEIEYFGRPTIWLEKEAKINSINKGILKIIMRIIWHFPFRKNKLLAPFIYIYGIK